MSSARVRVLLVSSRTEVTEALYGDPGASRYDLTVESPTALDEADAAAAFPVILLDTPAIPDGLALARRLRAVSDAVEVLVVVDDERAGVAAVRAGAFDYVVWPLSSREVLWAALGRCLSSVRPPAGVPSTVGPYRILRRLGAGGMAEVFLAVPQRPAGETVAREVVVKCMLPEHVGSEEHTAMFMEEARITAMLSHPNVVQVTDVGRADDSLFLVMEYVPGRNLEQVLRAVGPRLTWPLACHILAEVCVALAHAHEKRDRAGRPLAIIHRDVNPPNILLSEHGEVKLSDFGIAKHARSTQHTTPGALKGKLDYMSPEQVEGLPVDHRSDLFSAGAVLALLLTGVHPFRGTTHLQTLLAIRQARYEPPSTFVPDLPAELDRIVAKALAREPEKRYARASELADDLRAVVASAMKPVVAADIAALVVRAGGRSSLSWDAIVSTGSFHSASSSGSLSVGSAVPDAGASDDRTVTADARRRPREEETVRRPPAPARGATAVSPERASAESTVVSAPTPAPIAAPIAASIAAPLAAPLADETVASGVRIEVPTVTVAAAPTRAAHDTMIGAPGPASSETVVSPARGTIPASPFEGLEDRTDPTVPAARTRRPAGSEPAALLVAPGSRPGATTSWRPLAIALAVSAPLGALVASTQLFDPGGAPATAARATPSSVSVPVPAPPRPFAALSPVPAAPATALPAPTPARPVAVATAVATTTPGSARPTAAPAGATPRATLSPRRMGKLSVWMPSGWATIAVDGRPAGNAPVVGLDVPEGKHRVLLENATAGFRREYEVIITPERETVLKVALP